MNYFKKVQSKRLMNLSVSNRDALLIVSFLEKQQIKKSKTQNAIKNVCQKIDYNFSQMPISELMELMQEFN